MFKHIHSLLPRAQRFSHLKQAKRTKSLQYNLSANFSSTEKDAQTPIPEGSLPGEPQENLFNKYKDPKNRDDVLLFSHWNVNGLRSITKKNALQSYFTEYQPDILGLTEIRLGHEHLYENSPASSWVPEGYYSYFHPCTTKKGYSGTALISRIKPNSVQTGFPFTVGFHEEGRLIAADFDDYIVVVCYTPNSGPTLDRLGHRVRFWDPVFRGYLTDLMKKKKVILLGDFNVAHTPFDIFTTQGKGNFAGFTLEERDSFSQLLDLGLIDTFRHLYPTTKKYSWWSNLANSRERNKGWRIDYCLVDRKSANLVVDSSVNTAVMGSDHCPVELLYKVKKSN